MADPGADAFLVLPRDNPKGSAKGIFLRLSRYAWRYRARVLVSFLFAMIIAVSFGTLLIFVGTSVRMTVYKPATPEQIAAGTPVTPDPAVEMADQIAKKAARVKSLIGWAPAGLDTKFLTVVGRMRARPMYAIAVMCAAVLALAFLVGVARFLQEYLAGSVCAAITTDIENDMYRNIIRQPMGFFESTASGEILSRFANDAFVVTQGLMDVLTKLLREPFKAVVLFAIALSVDPWLALLGMGVIPPVFYVLVFIGKKMRRGMRRSLERIASLVAVVSESVRGIMIVKGYNMEAYEMARVNVETTRLQRYLRRLVRLDAAAGPLTEFMLIAGSIVFVMFSAYRVLYGNLDAGGLAQLYISLILMFDPMRKLSNVNNVLQKSAASAERVFEFIDLTSSIVEAPNAIDLPPLREGIRFENVRFSYDGKTEVLKGINIEIRKGENVALVGSSGAGKSTIVKLLPRFYDVTEGAVRIDGVDIRQATFMSLRDKISIVTQDTILFDDSIRENIAYGQQNYSEERIRDAARAAHALEFIEKLERGFDTQIGESGCTLSGGQRQRIAIARAIIKDPAILILDEATSSLDSESERLIQDALDRFVAGRTAIVIAHRLSTVQRADRILVLDDGRVAEEGTHQELLAQGGIYKRLYDIQFGLQKD